MALETTEQQIAETTEACCGSSHCGSSRRTVLRAAGVGGAAAAIGLTAAACSSSSSGSSTGSSQNNAAAGGGSSASAGSGSGSGSGSSALAATSDIPVDGGKIVNTDGGIVITQPASGTYKAFTAICTHSGCTVGSVSDNQITCPCHGSVFSAKDGSVINGPAQAPLAAKNIKVDGGQIFLA
ncbi:Rieske (2Fe-2S) protein [Actinocrinis sp.]|uniref:Rieske (2Fe-2S) protein n=1 Tax=Actinocrinis sp. TaxID=1920516 RepID=UPI002D493FEA|nr:Rieske (2Fe-2S) protein [Actinocrinis sp.]HZP53828.1 Rieske (2Fe-2S) protein [Actinocrinis sp.]